MTLLAAGVFAAALTWIPLGPEGGSITAISAGEPMFAGTAQGRLFRGSRDGRWQAIADLGAPVRIIEGDLVLAGTTLYRSLSPRLEGVVTFAVSPSSPNFVYAGTTSALHVSSDGGNTWSSRPGGATSIAVEAADSRKSWVVRANGDLDRSVDGGGTWSRVAIAEGVRRVHAHPRRAGVVFAEGVSEKGYRTTDATTWSEFFYLTGTVEFDPLDNNVFHAIDERGRLFRFENDGERFTIMHGGPILSIDTFADGAIAAGFRENGAAISVDGGGTFVAHNAGLVATEIHSIDVTRDGEVMYAGGVGTMFRSWDRGASWDPVFLLRLLPGPYNAVAIDDLDPQRVWIGAGVSLFFTADGGVRFNRLLWVPDREPETILGAEIDRDDRRSVWVLMSRGLLHFQSDPIVLTDRTPSDGAFFSLAIDETDARSIWLGGESRVLHSSDRNVTWRSIAVSGNVTSIHAARPLLIGTSNGDVFRSADGTTFDRVANLGAPVTSIVSDGRAYFAAADRVFTSTDGTTWRDTGGPARTSRLAVGDTIFAATAGGGVFALEETTPPRRRAARR